MRSGKVLFILLIILCAAFIAPELAWADETAAAPDAHHGGGKSLWDLFKATGWVGVLLVLLSIGGMALCLDNFVQLKEEKLAPADAIAQVAELIDQGEHEEAAEVCMNSPTYFGKVMGAGLVATSGGVDHALGAFDATAAEETFKLNIKISYLSLVGNVAPLIGLLGTVTGMISSFQVIETKKSPTPADLAVGVYESLVNTTMGLFIAIVFLVAYFILKNRVTLLTLGVTTIGSDLLKRACDER